MSNVLVTDGEHRSALAIVRSLGRAGHRVYVCSTGRHSLASASRHAAGSGTVPHPAAEPGAFMDALAGLIEAWSIAIVIPVTEASLLAVLPARESLGSVSVPFPDVEAFRRVSNKALLLDAAAASGIAVPEQCTVATPAQADRLRTDELEFPVVIKPARSLVESGGRRIQLGVGYAHDRAELAHRFRALPEAAYPVLLQRRITGPGIGVFLLLWNGRLLASFSHRRIREKPPAGGVSVYRESIPADPQLISRSRALLERFHWQGVAMVEYKVDAATGTLYLMEVNGRFWGSLQLAVDAGVDFPALLVDAACGRPAPSAAAYRCGVRSRWWLGDVDHLLARLRRSRRELALPDEAPGRLRTAFEFLKLWRPGDRGEVLRLSDPEPFVRESVDWLGALLQRTPLLRLRNAVRPVRPEAGAPELYEALR